MQKERRTVCYKYFFLFFLSSVIFDVQHTFLYARPELPLVLEKNDQKIIDLIRSSQFVPKACEDLEETVKKDILILERTINNYNLMEHALYYKCWNAAKVLLRLDNHHQSQRHSISLELPNKNGDTLLHVALAANASKDIIEHIITVNNSVLETKNDNDMTPLEVLVLYHDNPNLMDLLITSGSIATSKTYELVQKYGRKQSKMYLDEKDLMLDNSASSSPKKQGRFEFGECE